MFILYIQICFVTFIHMTSFCIMHLFYFVSLLICFMSGLVLYFIILNWSDFYLYLSHIRFHNCFLIISSGSYGYSETVIISGHERLYYVVEYFFKTSQNITIVLLNNLISRLDLYEDQLSVHLWFQLMRLLQR